MSRFDKDLILEIRDKILQELKDTLEQAKSIGLKCIELLKKGALLSVDFGFKGATQLVQGIQAVVAHKKTVNSVLVGLFIVIFFTWQVFAYQFSQAIFIGVNILLFAVMAAYISYMIMSGQNSINDLVKTLDDAVLARKKKEQEVAQLKSEIHDLKMASRKQMSFGKNSQALIDAVKKNRAEQPEGDLKGQFLLKSISQCYSICGGVVYMLNEKTNKYDFAGEYALIEKPTRLTIDEEDGLIGQVIKEGKAKQYSNINAEYLATVSGLGRTQNLSLYILPVKEKTEDTDKIVAIIEITSFTKLAVVDIWKDIDTLLLAED